MEWGVHDDEEGEGNLGTGRAVLVHIQQLVGEVSFMRTSSPLGAKRNRRLRNPPPMTSLHSPGVREGQPAHG